MTDSNAKASHKMLLFGGDAGDWNVARPLMEAVNDLD
jgi:hypothetical protein